MVAAGSGGPPPKRLVLVIAGCALLLPSHAAVGQVGPCGLDLQVSGGGKLAARGVAGSVDADLRVQIGPAGSYVVLESNCIRAEYEPYVDGHSQFGMRHLYIKSAGNEDQICPECNPVSYIGGGAFRGILESASVVWDRLDRKTVRFSWWNSDGIADNKIIEEVSIYPDSCFLKTDHIDLKYAVNIVDLGRPGGTAAGTHVAQGGDGWIRGYVTHDYVPSAGSYYNRYPPDGVNDPIDAGSLNYNGYFIVGVYNSANGRGFGRAFPVADISILKLLLSTGQRRGLEFFPHPFFLSHDPFTGFLYTVTGGETELLALGRQLVDDVVGSSALACGDAVELEATAHTGWEFDHWSGSLSGSANPTMITVNGQDGVTAVFRMAYAIHSEDFETYSGGADPDDWFDTAAGNSLIEEDNFQIIDIGSERVFGTLSTATNIHSHYTAAGAADWSSYEYSGRMRLTNTGGGVGVTFLSEFPVSTRCYRLRRGDFAGGRRFHISPNGTSITGGISDTGVTPLGDTWYRFRIQVQDTGSRTEIRAKVWPDVGQEPADWQVDCYDDSPSRITEGTVGVWSMAAGEKHWDELAIRQVNRAMTADFNALVIGDDPTDWLDTAAGSSLIPQDNFEVTEVDADPAFGTVSEATNIHTHYVGPNAECWGSYEYGGRTRITDTGGGIGVTFLSDFPISNRYYRLRRADFVGGTAFHLSPSGTAITAGVTDTGVVPLPNTWYRFRVEVTDTGSRTEIRTKVWAEGSSQPPTWQIDCYDDSVDRLTSGTIGLWSMGTGTKHWDDLTVSLLGLSPADSPPTCDDGSVCTADSCSGGSCVFTDTTPVGQCCDPVIGTLTPLDDGDPCTDDQCNADGTVAHTDTGQVVVNLRIEGISSPVTRDVTVVITTCGTSVDTRVVPALLDDTGSGTIVLNGIDAGAEWLYISEGHTLGTSLPLSFAACSATAEINGADRLLGGDFHTAAIVKDNLVDITDFSILAANFNMPIDANEATGADCTGDGVQDTADFTTFQANFFKMGDAVDGCGQAAPAVLVDGTGRLSTRTRLPENRITVATARTRRVASADLNGDGIIDEVDIRAFAAKHHLRLLPEFERTLAAVKRARSSRTDRN